MARANRYFVPGLTWHITHRCHDREFLLRAVRDRDAWRIWLYRARSRFGLCVLDYTVTSNHIHLLVFDESGDDTIARSMQLIESQTAQRYNRRRQRSGAFWEGRYHAVAVDSGRYLWRCLAYIDLNMVRAGVVEHPALWSHGGYTEIQSPRGRYRVLDLDRLAELSGCTSVGELQRAHREWIAHSMTGPALTRDPSWTDAIAIGARAFTESVRARLGLSSTSRTSRCEGDRFVLRECRPAYRR